MTAGMPATDTEVLVVGGGPIGLAAAIEARRAGRSVIVVEPRTGPIDKACGEGLMPGTLAALHRLGIDPDGHPLRGIAYRSPGRSVEHAFSSGPGRGVRRTTLHTALLEKAAEMGVVHVAARVDSMHVGDDLVRVGVRAQGPIRAAAPPDAPSGGRPETISARWLLACDGLHSTVRRLAGLERRGPLGGARRFGLRRHVTTAPWSDLVEVHWGKDAEAYVTPVADGLVGIALLGPPGAGFDETLAGFPELLARVDGASFGDVRGAGPLRQRTSHRAAGPIRLVGDASGYVDALTGEGLRLGLAQARAAVATLDSPRDYERAWHAESRDYRLLTAGLVAWATSPLRRAVVPVASAAPAVFGAVVERLAR